MKYSTAQIVVGKQINTEELRNLIKSEHLCCIEVFDDDIFDTSIIDKNIPIIYINNKFICDDYYDIINVITDDITVICFAFKKTIPKQHHSITFKNDTYNWNFYNLDGKKLYTKFSINPNQEEKTYTNSYLITNNSIAVITI
jgi:hypothetical protein